MSGRCTFVKGKHGWWYCTNEKCGYVFRKAIPKPPIRPCREAPDLIPIAQRLADETGDPTILDKIGHYGMALARYAASGFKTRSKEEVTRIYNEHCLPCEHRDHEADACKICGCPVRTEGMAIRNLLAMWTEPCPRDKWS